MEKQKQKKVIRIGRIWELMERNKKIGIILTIVSVIVIGAIIGMVIVNKARRNYKIEEITQFHYYTMIKDGKTGVIDTKGNILVEPIYDSIKIPNPSKDIFICIYDYNMETLDYKTKVLNAKSEEILTQYEEVSAIQIKEIVSSVPYEKSVLKFKQDGKYGLIDFNGKVVVKPIYDEINNISYKEGELLVKQEEKYGVINIKGVTLVDVKYDTIAGDNYYSKEEDYRIGGYIVGNRTEEGYRYGYINHDGKMILKIEYNKLIRLTEIEDDKNSYLIVEKNGKAGLVKNNKNILNYEYDDIEYDELNKIFIVQKDNKYGIKDFNGRGILPVEFDEISLEGMYIYANKENRNYVYNIKGEEKEAPRYQNIVSIANGQYNITIDQEGMYGVEDNQEQVIIPNKYYYVEYLFDDYFIVVGEGGKSGILNSKNETKLEIEYDVVQKIDGTNLIQTLVSDTGILEIYGKNLEKIVSMNEGKLLTSDNYIKLYSKSETKYFSMDGKEKSNIEIYPQNTLFAAKEGEKWGFIDKEGNSKVDYQYEKVTEFNSYGFAGIKLDGKWGVIDQEGNVLVEPIYVLSDMAGEPDFIGKYYRVISGYGETYYTDEIQ